MKQGTTHRPTSHLVHCALSLAVRRTQMAEQLCWFHWPLFVMAACAEAGCCCCYSPPPTPPRPQNSLLTSLAFARDSKAMSATEFHWCLPPQVLFFRSHCSRPTIIWLQCMTQHSFRNVIPVVMNVFYSDSKTDLKLRCNCIWISSYLRVPKMMLLDWQLCVACYYPTTPPDYPSTKRGMSVGPSVAVNFKFYGYLWFLSIGFVWIIWVQFITYNLSGKKLEFSTHSEPQSKG